MLPCRFTDGKEKSKYEVVPGPFIDKMRKNAGYYNKYCTYNSIAFQFTHGCIVCMQKGRYTQHPGGGLNVILAAQILMSNQICKHVTEGNKVGGEHG